MKVSKSWLKELVNLNTSIEEVEQLLPLRTIGLKETTTNYFELDMKGYNRADLLSMRGVAYEIAAVTGSEVNFEELTSEQIRNSWQGLPETPVKVENPNLTPIYCIAHITNLGVKQSSKEWTNKLSDCGVRSINNITDITNLVMLEYGQPLHAFDADKVQNKTLEVRCAKPGETLLTLDNKLRKLEASDLLITDPQKPLGLAGVMGGKDSEISDSTTAVLLEAAIFDPIALRVTSQRLGLLSEASKRFQHGLTLFRLLQALDAAVNMYETLGGKLVAITIKGNITDPQKQILLRQSKNNSLIGVEIPESNIETYLNKLHFQFTKQSVQGDALNSWVITVPYWRLDVGIEEDLIEEVARMYGYENIPASPLPKSNLNTLDQSFFDKIDQLRDNLVQAGLSEITTYSFFSTDVLLNLVLDKEVLIKVANPMSAETQFLRNSLWPNILEKAVLNLKQQDDLAIFEIGKVFVSFNNKTPHEEQRVCILLVNQTNNPLQELISLFNKINSFKTYQIKGSVNYDNFHPNRLLEISNSSGDVVGFVGEVHPRIVNKFGVEKRIAVLETNLSTVSFH